MINEAFLLIGFVFCWIFKGVSFTNNYNSESILQSPASLVDIPIESKLLKIKHKEFDGDNVGIGLYPFIYFIIMPYSMAGQSKKNIKWC